MEREWRTWAAENDLDAATILQVSHGRRAKDTLADFVAPECVDAAYQGLLSLEMADLDSVVALPGAAELLASLPRDRWAAVTSGGRELMSARLAAAGLPVPDVLVTAEDVDVGKPDPKPGTCWPRGSGRIPPSASSWRMPRGSGGGTPRRLPRHRGGHLPLPGQLAGYEVLPDLTCLTYPHLTGLDAPGDGETKRS